ncbi:hypothetical protein K8353_02790 [Burkholderia contaminans]|nr:hypothetical protein [Burkholderia contaminans]
MQRPLVPLAASERRRATGWATGCLHAPAGPGFIRSAFFTDFNTFNTETS